MESAAGSIPAVTTQDLSVWESLVNPPALEAGDRRFESDRADHEHSFQRGGSHVASDSGTRQRRCAEPVD